MDVQLVLQSGCLSRRTDDESMLYANIYFILFAIVIFFILKTKKYIQCSWKFAAKQRSLCTRNNKISDHKPQVVHK